MAEKPSSPQARRWIALGLVVLCLLISIPAFFAYRAERQLADSFRWVAHTMKVDRELQHLQELVVDAEAGQRGFLLIPHDSFLNPYRSALGKLPQQTALLRDLMADSPVQEEHLRELAPLITAKLSFMAESIALHQQGDHAAALALIGTDRGQQTMEAIRARIELMAREEARQLSHRQELLATHARSNATILAVLCGLNLVFAAAILVIYRRLSKAENLVTICAWSRTVEYEGEWLSFEQYLLRRFKLNTSHGISPDEAQKAIEEVSQQPE